MPVGPKALQAFKASGSPPMPQPPAPGGAPGASAPVGLPGPKKGPPGAPGAAPPPAGGGDTAAMKKAAVTVQHGQTDPEVEQMMATYAGDGQPPPGAADADLWHHVVEVCKPEAGGLQQFPDVDPWMVAGQMYSDLGGEIDPSEGMEDGGLGHEEPDADDMAPPDGVV